MDGTTQRVQAIAWLRQSFPSVFSLDTKPLKIGITQDILAGHLDGAPDEVWIQRAIGYYKERPQKIKTKIDPSPLIF